MIDDKKEEKKIGDKDNSIKSEDDVEHKFYYCHPRECGDLVSRLNLLQRLIYFRKSIH